MKFCFVKFKFLFTVLVTFSILFALPQTKNKDDNPEDIKFVDQAVEQIKNEKKNLIDALDLFDKALAVAIENKYTDGELKLYFCSAAIYRNIGHYEKAIENYSLAEKIAREMNYKEWEAKIVKNEALVYYSKGDIDKSIKTLKKSIDLYREMGAEFNRAVLYENLAHNYFEKGIYDSALIYNRKSLEIYPDDEKESKHFLNTKLNTVKYLNRKDDFTESIKQASILSNDKKVYNYPDLVIELHGWWARSYASLKKFDLAISKMGEAESYLTSDQHPLVRAKFYKAKSEVCALEGNNHDALDYLQKTLALKDSFKIAQNNILLEKFKKRLEIERDIATQKSIEFLEEKNKSKYLIIIVLLIAGTMIVAYAGFHVKRKSELLEANKSRELAISNKKFESFLNQTKEAVRLVEPDGKMIIWNRASEELTGVNKSKVIGQDFLNLIKTIIPESQREAYLQWSEYVFDSIKADKKFETRESVTSIKNKNNEDIFIQNKIFPIYTEEDVLIAGTSFDVTEQIKYEKGLEEAKELAESSDRKKTEFLAQMSHEIRTPINTILNFCSLIEMEMQMEGKSDDELKNYFDGINRSGKRIIKMMDMFLNISEIRSGMVDIKKDKFDLVEKIIEPLIKDFSYLAEEKNLRLEINKTNEKNIIYGDEYSITQTITNLIDASIRFADQGRIDIIIKQNKAGNVILRVCDEGTCSSEEELDSFVQTDKMTIEKEAGFKLLGLQLVKKYCELNDIDLKVDYEKSEKPKFELLFKT